MPQKRLIGTDHNQVPTNGMLGSMAFQDAASVSVDNLALARGSASAPSLDFANDLDTGLYSPGENQIALTTGGTGRLFIDSTGQLEAGSLGSAAAPVWSFLDDMNTGIYSPGADQLALATGGAGRLFVDSSGNVGIGASAPLDVLDVVGTGSVRVRVRSTSGASFAGHLYQNSDTGTSTSNGLYAGIDGSEIGYLYHYGNNALVLGTNSLERLRITDNGRVGIGTSAPDAVLHTYANISGGSPATSGSSDPNIIARFQGLSVAFDIGGTAAGLQWIQPRLYNNYASNFGLALCPNGGNVGIGTTTPASALHINQAVASGTYQSRITLANTDQRTIIGSYWRSGVGQYSVIQSTNEAESIPGVLLLNPSGGNVGIGTSAPGQALDVKGSVRSSIGTGTGAGGAGYALYQFGTSATATENWHIGSEGDGSFRFYNLGIGAGLERLRITSAGLVGIGTSAPGYILDCSQSANTDVAVNVTNSNASSGAIAEFRASNGTNSAWYGIGGTGYTPYAQIRPNGAAIYTSSAAGIGLSADNASGYITFGTGSGASERMRLDSSGRLLIGTSTARANFYNGIDTGIFQVEGANDFTKRFSSFIYGRDNLDGPLLLLGKHRGTSVGGTTVVASGDEIGRITFQGSDGTQFVAGAEIYGYVDGTPGADDMPGRLVFSTTSDGASSPTERVRISSTGALGFSGANYGTSGQVLTSNGSGSAPSWQDASAAGGDPDFIEVMLFS